MRYPKQYDDEFLNTIKQLIDLAQQTGRSVQDLVAEGQLTPEQYAELITVINGLIKSGHVDKSDLIPEFKDEIEGFSAQLAQTPYYNEVRLKDEKIEPEDISDGLLGLVTGEGTVNVLSIPQDASVTLKKINPQTLENFKSPIKTFELESGNINISTGENSNNIVTRLRSGFIRVRQGDKIFLTYPSGNLSIYEYNLDGSYVRRFTIPTAHNTLTIENDSYIRLLYTPSPSDLDISGMKNEIANNIYIFNEIFFSGLDRLGYIHDFYNEIKNYIVTGKNLFNKATVVTGYLVENGSIYTASDTYRTSDFIKVEKNVPLHITQPRKISLFHTDYVHVKHLDIGDSSDTVVTPEQDGYIRVSVSLARIDTTQVEIGEERTSYEEYRRTLKYGTTPQQSGGSESSHLKGKVVLNLGDSISLGSGNGYAHMIANKNEMVLYNYSSNGATVSDLTDNEPTRRNVQKHLNEFITQNPNVVPDYILVEGGTNDINIGVLGDYADWDYGGSYNIREFCGGLESVFYTIRTTFPTAKILFVAVHKMDTRNREKQDQFHDMVLNISKKWSVPVADVFNEGQLNPEIPELKALYAPDGTHPNAEGYSHHYVPLIESKLKTL